MATRRTMPWDGPVTDDARALPPDPLVPDPVVPDPVVPDTKDWTWVLARACPECGYDATAGRREEFGALVRANAARWPGLLAGTGATARPDPVTWSVLEYACHVRDVHRIFRERLQAMLEQDAPRFANWDQDATAVEDAYHGQDPRRVGEELVEAAEAVARVYDGVPDDRAWARSGTRSNGDVFTVESLGRYHLHDVVHHAWDVAGPGSAVG